jgi:glycosyltransferase involved in cell wall biosynthesis
MILGIDASNIRGGGGITHLVELLKAAHPLEHGFGKVIVWSGQETLSKIEDRPWLVKSHQPQLDGNLLGRIAWQRYRLSRLAKNAGCDVLFVPGGSYAGSFRPIVAFSQNLLPFDKGESRRYGWSPTGIRLRFLSVTQARTFRRADGLIFLTRHARDAVMRRIGTTAGETRIIPHGIDGRFACPPREQLPIGAYSNARPLRILYVSIIDVYKHQWHVAEAVARLRARGLPVTLDLIGPAYAPAWKRFRQTMSRVDPEGEFVSYSGTLPHDALPLRYAGADIFLFASSCETFGQILLEAMYSGLPIACSERSSMPELLGEAGRYFDPEDPEDIARVLVELIDAPDLRARCAAAAYQRASAYSWQKCARDTFSLLAEVACAYADNSTMPGKA